MSPPPAGGPTGTGAGADGLRLKRPVKNVVAPPKIRQRAGDRAVPAIGAAADHSHFDLMRADSHVKGPPPAGRHPADLAAIRFHLAFRVVGGGLAR